MHMLEVLDNTKSDREAIGVLEAKHQVLYVFYYALFNFLHLKYFWPYFGFIDLIGFENFKKLETSGASILFDLQVIEHSPRKLFRLYQ